MQTESLKTTIIFLFMAFCSGVAALIYESIWLRWFKILFGNTAYAASVTLAAFFAGISIGAIIFGRISQRTSRCLRLYGWLELAIVFFSLLVPLLIDFQDSFYPYLYEKLRYNPGIFTGVKFMLAFVVILPASISLGGTLPLMVRAYLHDSFSLGKQGNRVYAVNTLGAVVGAALGALWLPEIIGLKFTYGVGMLFSLIAALTAFFLGSRSGLIPAAIHNEESSNKISIQLLMIAGASGFGTLALEVFLMHALSQMFDNSVYSVGAVLIVVLLALAIGATFVSVTSQRISVLTLLRTALIVESGLVMTLPWFSNYLLERYGFVPGTLSNGLYFALVLGGPAIFIGGLVFPLTFRLANNDFSGQNSGNLLAVNMIGGVVGSTLAGFYLLEKIGIWWSFGVLGLGYGVAAILIEQKIQWRIGSGIAVLILILVVFLSSANPGLLPLVALDKTELLVDYAQGPHGVISVVHRPKYGDYRIKMNNHYTLSGSGVNKLAERGGHIPLLLHPEPKFVAFIGSATGITAGAAMLHQVKKVELIELVPEVRELASRHFGDYNRNVYQDHRTEVVIEDGRNHLRATRQKYDVIVADLFVPWRPGVGSMYTKEHFQSVRDRLAEGGIFCQWLPVFQLRQQDIDLILATFSDVFPDTSLWRSNFSAVYPRFALIGRKGIWPEKSQVEQRIKQLQQVSDDHWVTNPKGFWMQYIGPLHQGLLSEKGKSLNTDNNPIFEYQVSRSTFNERVSYLSSGDWMNFTNRIQQTEKTLSNWPIEESSAGQLYARADAQFVKDLQNNRGISDKLINLLERLRKQVPNELLSYDQTVADVSVFFKGNSD